jgi:hypothetical protein
MNQPDSETVAAPNLYDVTMRLAFATFAMRWLSADRWLWRWLLTLDQSEVFTELSVIDGCRKAERRWRNLIPAGYGGRLK